MKEGDVICYQMINGIRMMAGSKTTIFIHSSFVVALWRIKTINP